MGDVTGISWTDHTLNFWIGCEEEGPECDNCYAKRGSARLAAQHGLTLWGGVDSDRYVTKSVWKSPAKWNREAEREGRKHRVFCASFADVGEDRPDLVEPRQRLAATILDTPWLEYQLLTKRPQNLDRLFLPYWPNGWPSNVIAGATVGIQSRIDRAHKLVTECTAPRKFLSCEPLLGPLSLDVPMCVECGGTAREPLEGEAATDPVIREWHDGTPFCARPDCNREMQYLLFDGLPDLSGIGWVIVGGESGHKARPMAIEWAERLVDECMRAGVPTFMKQMGKVTVTEQRPGLEPGTWGWSFPWDDPAGEDPAEWFEKTGRTWPRLHHGDDAGGFTVERRTDRGPF